MIVSRRSLLPIVFVLPLALLLMGCSSLHSSASHPTTTTLSHSTTTSTTSPSGPPATTDTLTSIAFFNSMDGYGLFTRQGGINCENLVGPTADGGVTFGPLVAVTSWTCGNGGSAGSLAFDDHGDGFLYGPDLVVTHDGGKSWVQNSQPGTVLSVEALGSSVWMLETGCPSTSSSATCPLRLLESPDGGRSWSASSAAPPGALGSPHLEAALGQTWLVRLSQLSAYLLTSPASNQQGLPDHAPLWFTQDGGKSWVNRSIPCPIDGQSMVLSAAPTGALLAVCAGEPGAGSQAKSALRSTDGGATWTVQLSCPFTGSADPSSCASDPLDLGYLGGIDAVSAETVFLYGDRSSLLVSHDAGVQWQAVQPPIGDTSAGTQQTIFFNGSNGVVLGEDGNNNDVSTLWSTSDGGAQWIAVVPETN